MALDNSAFKHIRATVQTLIDDGIHLQDDPTTVALEFWTAAHGVAAMLIAKPHLPFGDAEAFADRVLLRRLSGAWWSAWLVRTSPPRMVAWVRARPGW